MKEPVEWSEMSVRRLVFKSEKVFCSFDELTEGFYLFHRRAVKCLTAFPTRLFVDGWPQAALTDTSDCGTLAPKVPLCSKYHRCLNARDNFVS